jgi:hypothetical protein
MFFTKKPVKIEAYQYDGSKESAAWLAEWIVDSGHQASGVDGLIIETLEGTFRASPMDWVIKGIKGEFYPCKPDIFEATYDLIG